MPVHVGAYACMWEPAHAHTCTAHAHKSSRTDTPKATHAKAATGVQNADLRLGDFFVEELFCMAL